MKSDDKVESMILIGYHNTGGYKLSNAVNKMIVTSRDMIFNEIKEFQQPVTGYHKVVPVTAMKSHFL